MDDTTKPTITDENRCACCAIRVGGHGHFGSYCEPCAERPLANCNHGFDEFDSLDVLDVSDLPRKADGRTHRGAK